MLIAYLLACLVIAFAAVVIVLMRFTRRVALRAEASVPPDGQFLEIDGERLHYVDFGHGPAIVFIHGLCGQLRNFAYLPLAALAHTHRIVLIDRPGSGYSTRASGRDAAIAWQANVVAQVIDKLELDRPLIVGHSLGGAVSLRLALDHPQRVGALALIAPLTQPVSDVPAPFRALAIRSAWWRRWVGRTLAVPVGMMTGRTTLTYVFGPEDAPKDFLIRGGGVLGFRPGNFEAGSGDILAAERDMSGLAAHYAELTVPVDILYGRGDRILDYRQHGERMPVANPRIRLALVDGGHMLPVTQPEATMQWLQEVTARMPSTHDYRPRNDVMTVPTQAANDAA
ncbi:MULTISPECIES: alpha/beta hydrolase [Pandoraea]|uniref:alpha/beta fold hydrolase n=1 Tax=Pandoraea TaxID=93217 RepID=UPI001F5DF052|nr:MULTISPECIES: alpha/beta hydrolase [Pandoraea]MCI3204604.1 alpha/beta hydrolase [Pandoraea sp. LA3]MDN4582632.1 alpha/beta hydrolase [Pandoraea capi]